MTRLVAVTGAARGLGKAIAAAAIAQGDSVALIDHDDEVLATASTIGGNGYVASVSDQTAIENVLDDLGTPDLWVNNAGIVRFGPLLTLELEDWRSVIDVNLDGVFACGQAVARRMAERGSGAIVNVTSMNGVAPGPNAGAYGSAKAAVALLTQQMALEWGPLGIRVNAVAPGLIDAGMSEPIYADAEIRAARESRVPLGRLGQADDIAEAVLFLGSDKASYITGQNLIVDGGVTMSVISSLPRPANVDGVGPQSLEAPGKESA
jgi:NAD(P)-dependent dehydrogenase (short-subunit alcohol dehydrogenase family)